MVLLSLNDETVTFVNSNGFLKGSCSLKFYLGLQTLSDKADCAKCMEQH